MINLPQYIEEPRWFLDFPEGYYDLQLFMFRFVQGMQNPSGYCFIDIRERIQR
jgi:hypothetical protein